MILCFSGTGNSRYIEKKIADKLQDEIVDINAKIRAVDYSPIKTGDNVIVVTPTYAWRIPRIVSDWLSETELLSAKRIWFVMNCGSEIGNAAKYNRNIAEQKHLCYMGTSQILMPENYIAMFNAPQLEEAKEIVDNNTVVVVVDTNKPSYTECEDLLSKTKTIVVLDHHRQGAEVISNAVLSYIEPFASSACEMVAEILQYFSDEIRIYNIEADALYAGIVIDTDNFTSKTGVRTFEAAAFLRRCGADVTRVRKMFRDDVGSYRAKAETVRTVETYRDSFAIGICPSSGLDSPTIVAAQAANELLDIDSIKASFVLTDYNNLIYISARAIDEVNVQLIMERLGGGGHINVAGAQLKDATVNGAIIQLKDTIDQMIKEGAI